MIGPGQTGVYFALFTEIGFILLVTTLAGALAGLRSDIGRDRAAVGGAAGRADRAAVDLGRLRQRLEDLDRRAVAAALAGEKARRDLLRHSNAQLAALDPQATLSRGYAVVHKGGRVVSSVSQVDSGDALIVKVADGGFPARVAAPGSRRRRRQTATPHRAEPVEAPIDDDRPKPRKGVQAALFP